jgi:hypothetical protein
MGVVSNIIDAVRRIGSPTQKSALKRQDAQLEGKVVLGRWQTHVNDPLGDTTVFTATIAPVEETVVILSEEEVRPISENAVYGLRFLRAFGVTSGSQWSLDDLDKAFEAWLLAPDKLGYSDEAVMELLGAMFGHYCATQLNMRWIRLTDGDGTTLAIDGVEREFRAFPYQVISKRIADREFGFFRPVFILVKKNSMEARSRAGTA